ncbi:MAG: response regulator transcription factor [Oscillospiraceae bacterium]|nr:response regulator transcription factor [Oscillospiraceae bacterium]
MVDILIVEDNTELCTLLCDFLRAEGYTVSTAQNGEKALSLYERYGARLVLLDINLPDTDGFAVCRRIRERDNTPVLILTARTDKEDKLNGLVLGADDYIEKPYDIDILIAKIKGIFRRRLARDMITEGDLILNLADGTASKGGSPLALTAKEFELLRLLIENKGQTLTKEYLFERVWGSDSESEPQTLTVHIKWLRQKTEKDPKSPVHIVTVWGKGYRWENEDL